MSDEHWSAVYDSARAFRVQALRPFGVTDRQARFLVTVMAHSGSFLERQYCAFAGIARGQNSRDFVAAWWPAAMPRRSHTAASAAVGSITFTTSRSTKPSASQTTGIGSRRRSVGWCNG